MPVYLVSYDLSSEERRKTMQELLGRCGRSMELLESVYGVSDYSGDKVALFTLLKDGVGDWLDNEGLLVCDLPPTTLLWAKDLKSRDWFQWEVKPADPRSVTSPSDT